ncbi:MAG: MucB/RseB C-terminal domain-containing protein [Candidatus Thiodiazotropha sp. (ex Lucinoma borealis)]|nr:MucB/RseB C-terminal domain-containing protein [Candidatus Thiodiazotropha sp. (ex Troendleina suluensis)]MCU7865819.1 MucB/RseB C-terminal domain-containing protein [Candidatus Thiodiazotropha sp. (ex Lucinoma borealis)]MCU7869989.1 MucB/RseB C-terminal domain-containing protein [Candidatus Thiodiazotropha sp. (ex Lucinoma borealis)]
MSPAPVNRTFKQICLVLCLSVAFCQPVIGNDNLTPKDWLERMMEAVQKLNYQGTFIYLHDNQLETMKIAHAVEGDRVRESLMSLNGTPREVIRDAESVTCVLPDSQEVSVDKRTPSDKFLNILPQNLAQLEDHYNFQNMGKTRIASRQAQVVMIMPNDRLRYGYRFSLDTESGFPLKSDLMNEQGELVEQTMFTNLQIGIAEISELHHRESLFTYRLKNNPGVAIENPQINPSKWDFMRLPNGFRLSMQHQLPDPLGSDPIEQYVFSDGLSSLSVFIEAETREEAFSGVSRLGAVNAWGGQVDGYQVTAVGEVPAVTILGVVQGMQLKQ